MKSLDGPWYVPIWSLLLKCIKLQFDSNQSIEVIEPKIGVAKIKFFEKYEHSVGFCIIAISMKSANTEYISSLVTGFQSRILERYGRKLLACIFVLHKCLFRVLLVPPVGHQKLL